MTTSRKTTFAIVTTIVIGAIIIAGFAFLHGWGSGDVNAGKSTSTDAKTGATTDPATVKSDATPETITGISEYKYTETYSSTSHNFSFKYQSDFTVTAIPADANNPETILVQNLPTRIGLQIIITPFNATDTDMTADFIKSNIPDLAVDQAMAVAIGGSSNKGLEFTSNNPAFGGQSAEVWFVHAGNLYQVSTYSEMGKFMEGLVGTWMW